MNMNIGNGLLYVNGETIKFNESFIDIKKLKESNNEDIFCNADGEIFCGITKIGQVNYLSKVEIIFKKIKKKLRRRKKPLSSDSTAIICHNPQ